MSDQNTFVRRTKRKLSALLGAARGTDGPATKKELLETLLTEVRAAAKATENPVVVAKSQIADLIVPKILTGSIDPDEPENPINLKACKTYAMALGEMVGMIAGLALQDQHVDAAIDEVMKAAKRSAKKTREGLKSAGFSSRVERAENPSPVKAQGLPIPTPSTEQQEAMIRDLEAQAAIEKDLATAAALRGMASNARKALDKQIAEGKKAA